MSEFSHHVYKILIFLKSKKLNIQLVIPDNLLLEITITLG